MTTDQGDPVDGVSTDGISGQLVEGGLRLPGAQGQRPTEPGFYMNEGSAQVMVHLLTQSGQWMVVMDTGQIENCEWGYIEQTLLAFPLVRIGDVSDHKRVLDLINFMEWFDTVGSGRALVAPGDLTYEDLAKQYVESRGG